MKKLAAFFVFLLACDFLTKKAALGWIPPVKWMSPYPFGGIGIFDVGAITFSLNFVTNTGAAWGIFPDHSGFLFGLRAVVISALIIYLSFFNKGKTPAFPMWLIVTGATGNAIDYLSYGHVIDFLHFTFFGHTFPVFNLADSYITLGAVGLFFSTKMKKVEAPS
ncbi:MAG: signal peptidase II [Verrucomicrobia bacterium]|nr:signal peptidase II [Verrucomicrobiota bacterium]